MKVQNELIKKEVSSMMSGNFTALRVLAVNPSVEEFLTVAPEQRTPNAKNMVQNVNSLFHDDSNIIIADSTGQQLVRSDDSKLVSVASRDYFQAAMKGEEYVSDVIVSKTTGLAIVVIEVPVKDSSGKVIGMIQRNYNISTLSDFLKKEADAETELAIFESNGKVVAHSSFQIAKEEDRIDMSGYDFIKNASETEESVGEIEIDGDKKLIGYEREPQTGWIIASFRPYSAVESQAIDEALVSVGICVVILILIAIIATIISNKTVKPILIINETADEISKGNLSLKEVNINSNDELGRVAAAFDVMTGKLNGFFHKARASAKLLEESSETLNEHSRQSAEAANQIAEVVSDFASDTVQQQNATSEAQNAVDDMVEMLRLISVNSDE